MTAPDQTAPAVVDGDNLQEIYQKEIARKPYRFFWADRWWELPHIAELDWKIQVEIEQFGNNVSIETVDELFGKMFGPEQAEAWGRVVRPLPFLEMLFSRWTAHSGREPGEPSASDSSSPSTRRPSKRTSTGSTGSASRKRSTAAKKAATRRGSS